MIKMLNPRYVIAYFLNQRNVWWFCDGYNKCYADPVENIETVIYYENNMAIKHTIIKVNSLVLVRLLTNE